MSKVYDFIKECNDIELKRQFIKECPVLVKHYGTADSEHYLIRL